MVDMNYDVFLSHNSKDKSAVEQIATLLKEKYGLKCWLDKWNLVPGEPWQEALEEALEHCRTIAVFVGANEISPWENEEMRSALETRVHDKERRVIPVLLPGAPDSRELELPRFLSRLTWVDFRGGLEDENALYRLYCGILGIKPGSDTKRGGTGGIWATIGHKVKSVLFRAKRKRTVWISAVGFALLFLVFLGLSGNLPFDVPFFCGRKSSSVAGYINQAIKQRDGGRSACALQSLNGGLELQPTNAEKSHIYYLFASIYLNEQEPIKALESTNLGLQNEADNGYAYLLHAGRGFAYCQLRQNPDAVREFNIFLEMQPERAGSLANSIKDLLADFNAGKDMSAVCWVLGAEALP